MKIIQELLYSASHEWVRVDGDVATVGISDFAQDALGDVVFFEAPDVGTEVSKGGSMGEVESVKAVSDVYAPISGEVVEVNEDLEDAPELVNQEPYAGGWMVKIRLSEQGELQQLLSADAYQKQCEDE